MVARCSVAPSRLGLDDGLDLLRLAWLDLRPVGCARGDGRHGVSVPRGFTLEPFALYRIGLLAFALHALECLVALDSAGLLVLQRLCGLAVRAGPSGPQRYSGVLRVSVCTGDIGLLSAIVVKSALAHTGSAGSS